MAGAKSFDINLIRIDDITVVDARIDNPAKIIIAEKGKHKFRVDFHIDMAVNIVAKKLKLILSCSIETYDESGESLMGLSAKFDLSFVFIIENLEEVIGSGPDFEIGEEMAVALSNISYGTSRGVIHTRCQGTPLRTFIMPILPTNEIVKLHQTGRTTQPSSIDAS